VPAAAVLGALALTAAGTAVVLASATAPTPPPALGGGGVTGTAEKGGNGQGADNPGHPITVTGSVVGTLRPGQPAAVDVTVRNDNRQPIVVTSVTAVVTSVAPGPLAGPACTSGWYTVGTFTGTQTIARRASGVVSLPIALVDLPAVNQDSCQGATLQLRFTAQARQA